VNKELFRKLDDLLDRSHHTYTLKDIIDNIEDGRLQSHVFGDTWVITEVHNFPKRKVVHIPFAVGYVDDVLQRAEPAIAEWAIGIGADMMTTVTRTGYLRKPLPGWDLTGLWCAKELRNG